LNHGDIRAARSMGLSPDEALENLEIFGMTIDDVDEVYARMEAQQQRHRRAGFTGMT